MIAGTEELLRHAGARIRLARAAAGLSQQQLADRIGMARASVANLEAGRQDMSITRLAGIATALGVDVGSLVTPGSLPVLPPPPHKIRVQPVYEASCETCGGLVLDITADRSAALESGRVHVAARREQIGMDAEAGR